MTEPTYRICSRCEIVFEERPSGSSLCDDCTALARPRFVSFYDDGMPPETVNCRCYTEPPPEGGSTRPLPERPFLQPTLYAEASTFAQIREAMGEEIARVFRIPVDKLKR